MFFTVHSLLAHVSIMQDNKRVAAFVSVWILMGISLCVFGYVCFIVWQDFDTRNDPVMTQTIMAPPGYTRGQFLEGLRQAECERLLAPPTPVCNSVPTVHLAPPNGQTREQFFAALYEARCGDLDQERATNISLP
jgi:hypothetical protein